MEQLIGILVAAGKNNLPFLVALFGWIVTGLFFRDYVKYTRDAWRSVSVRHDKERDRHIQSIEKLTEVLTQMNLLLVEVRARMNGQH